MAIERLKLRFTGQRPLIMHNARLADPLDEAAKALKEATSKRKKTDDDHVEVAKLEFIGSLYLDENMAPVIPSDMVLACVTDGAKKSKNGKKFKEAVWCEEAHFGLKYEGPKDPLALWDDARFRLRRSARVGQQRIMRTRPRFPSWQVDVSLSFDTTAMDRAEIVAAAETAGAYSGIGDWRPQYGRFTVEVMK